MFQNLGPIWTVAVSRLFDPSKVYNHWTYVALIILFLGGFFISAGEVTGFPFWGLVFSNLSCILRIFRLVIQERVLNPKILASEYGITNKLDPILLLYYAAPFNFAFFFTVSIIYEGRTPWFRFISFDLAYSTYFYLFLTGGLAACFNIFAFYQVQVLGALVTLILSQLKMPVMIIVSFMLFGNIITFQQILGLFGIILGVMLYSRKGGLIKNNSNSNNSNTSVNTNGNGNARSLPTTPAQNDNNNNINNNININRNLTNNKNNPSTRGNNINNSKSNDLDSSNDSSKAMIVIEIDNDSPNSEIYPSPRTDGGTKAEIYPDSGEIYPHQDGAKAELKEQLKFLKSSTEIYQNSQKNMNDIDIENMGHRHFRDVEAAGDRELSLPEHRILLNFMREDLIYLILCGRTF